MNRIPSIGPVLKMRAGTGQLTVERVRGESRVTGLRAASPLRLLAPASARGRGSAWVYGSTLGGGLLPGDELDVSARVLDGARCWLGSQASTKVFRNPLRQPCGQRLRATVGEGALLVVAPDPVQPFAEALYRQTQTVELHPGGGLVLVDWVTSGRSARSERWQFHSYRSHNEVWMSGEKIWMDALELDHASGSLLSSHRLGRFNCVALVVILGSLLAGSIESVMAQPEQVP